MNKDQIEAKLKKLQLKLDALNKRIAADTAARKATQKEIEDLKAAQIVDLIRSVSGSSSNVAQDFADFLQTRAAAAAEVQADHTRIQETEDVFL